LSPFSGARLEIHQPYPCCQSVRLVCWLFFNFVTLFDFGCCSLTQEMSFANRYLPYFRQRLITNPLLALSHFQSLFTESLCGDQFLTPSPFSSVLRQPWPLCCVFFFSSLFIIQLGFLVFFQGVGGQSVQGTMLFYPRGGCANTTCCLFAHLLICWMSPKQVWSEHLAVREHSWFLSVNGIRKFYRLGGSECWSFDSCLFFFSAKCCYSI
jgi:hypothetical protein